MIEERDASPTADTTDMHGRFRGRRAPTALTARGTGSSELVARLSGTERCYAWRRCRVRPRGCRCRAFDEADREDLAIVGWVHGEERTPATDPEALVGVSRGDEIVVGLPRSHPAHENRHDTRSPPFTGAPQVDTTCSSLRPRQVLSHQCKVSSEPQSPSTHVRSGALRRADVPNGVRHS
jgi:hypothetical protein